MLTVVELPEFSRKARSVLSEPEKDTLVDWLARKPESGDIIEDTGGVRKLRWSCGSKGKRGGARVIYYYRNRTMPLFLVTIYKKGKQDNLTKQQSAVIAKLAAALVKIYGERHV